MEKRRTKKRGRANKLGAANASNGARRKKANRSTSRRRAKGQNKPRGNMGFVERGLRRSAFQGEWSPGMLYLGQLCGTAKKRAFLLLKTEAGMLAPLSQSTRRDASSLRTLFWASLSLCKTASPFLFPYFTIFWYISFTPGQKHRKARQKEKTPCVQCFT